MKESSRESLERIVEQFESVWHSAERQRIEDCITAADTQAVDRQELILELVHAELELRLKTGDAARIEDYLDRFPELAANRDCLLELVRAEFEIRRNLDSSVEIKEFAARFEDLKAELLNWQADLPTLAGGDRLVRLTCPHCHEAIELKVSGAVVDTVCPSCDSAFRVDSDVTVAWSDDRLPRLGRFQLLQMVGRGAFGTVYRAIDTELDRIVAVKVPRTGRFSSDADRERFEREGRSVAQLDHPGIVSVYEIGVSDEAPFIASEFIDGMVLVDALRLHRLSFRSAASLVASICDALEHAHERGVVHRDLKPSNIMLQRVDSSGSGSGGPSGSSEAPSHVLTLGEESYVPRLMDFGLARRDADEITMTLEGHVLGTPAYVSPEQIVDPHTVDGRADLYSVGVILYHLITGDLPFSGAVPMVLQQALHDTPLPPRKRNDRIPRDLETICLKAMSREAGQRYASAGEFADDLRRFVRDEPVHARPAGWLKRGLLFSRRIERIRDVGIFLVVYGIVGLGYNLITFLGLAGMALMSVTILQHVHDPQRAALAMLANSLQTCLLIAAGTRIVRRKRAAIWVATALLIYDFIWWLAIATERFQVTWGGLIEPAFAWDMVAIQPPLLLAIGIAHFSWFWNRQAIAWSEQRQRKPAN